MAGETVVAPTVFMCSLRATCTIRSLYVPLLKFWN